MKIIILTAVFISFSVQAYTPTLESLLRNGNNAEIGDKTVLATMSLIQLNNNSELSGQESVVVKETALKILINNLNENTPQLLELIYADPSFSSKSLATYKKYPFNNIHKLARSNEYLEKKFFYSIMGSLLQNDGTLLLQLLKSFDVPVKFNSELINQEKSTLLYRYRNYLKSLKEGESEASNPLKSEDPVAQENINKILSENFFKKDEMVVREKSGDEFNWVIRSNETLIRFDSSNRLKFIQINSSLGTVEAMMGKYISFESGLEFPEVILLKDLVGNKYEVKLSSLKLLNDTGLSFNRREKKYLEDSTENKIDIGSEKPKFL